ncbi:GH92 family glycosyl hydrolase [Massilia sp. DD77]|uniref:GH92 family glycosyl hydrolase n=1 Tax=Massilia sp. DD77 TaxID=3109349 RepID=UPI003000978E
MKTNTIIRCAATLLASCAFSASAQVVGKLSDPVEWVNPLMGTASKPELSNGNTYPAIAVPWGMNFWTPQTGKMGNGWAYTYDADRIRGFKQTHQPSPWMNDYGQFAVMPVTGAKRFNQDARASWFSHKSETAKPYYYSVYLADADVTTEIAPTERAAQFRFTFPKSDASYVVVDAFDKGSYVKILPDQRRVIGYSTRHARGPLPKNFRNYFVIEFDQAFASSDTWQGDKLAEGRLEMEGEHSGALIGFKTAKGQKVHMRVASSFISFEQAELNLKRELAQDDFEATRAKGKAAWNGVLGRLQVEGGSVDQTRTFYSSLYRTVLFPNKMYELDAAGKPVHWSPYNGQVLPGRLFAGTGFWDTFRALYPFLNLVYPSINSEMQEGLANAFKEGGWLPEWSSPGYADIMVGNNSASVVADAWIKGVRGQDIETLWQALKKGANNEGPMTAVGRAGVKYYNELGYVPYDVGINENAARTLEYAYDDFTIYQLGKALGKPKSEIDIYAQRSMNYRKLFDPETGLMRGRKRDGSFQTPFNPFKWGDAFTEGNSWHYSWSVFHDVAGLADLMGGRKAFVDKLDMVFSLPPIYDESYYGSVIHEIREMQIANMGQYAHGNQPIQHMTYLYNYAGAPWKAQHWIRETMDRMYAPTPDGYCGDEDNGQTSAWYVFSALGFYPVTPGVNQYVVGTPLFKKATVRLENGRSFTVNAQGDGRYVDALRVNGRAIERTWLGHDELMKGAKLEFSMSAKPNTKRGTREQDAPYSLSRELKP